MPLRIERVVDKKQLNDFIMLPWRIYEGNRCWVPPLINEVKETLSLDENPFWKHARRDLYLAYGDNGPVGRIAAIVDDNHINFHEERVGFFGFFECINDQEHADALWEKARDWLRAEGMQTMRGPVNPSMNDENAFLLEGFDMPATVMMPYTPKYYLELAENYGLKKAKDMYALIKYAKDGIPDRIEKMIRRIKARTGVTIRHFDMKEFGRDAQFLKDIYNAAWEKNWGFVPMTDDEMNLAAKKLKQFVDPELVLFAEIDGKPIGVSVTVPDINQVLIKLNGRMGLVEIAKFLYYKRRITGVRSLIGGVMKQYRESGIIAVLYYESERANVRLGYDWCELGWNLEDNDLINKFDIAIGGKIYKKYRIYEMAVP
jgi:hypothetical protein